MSMVRMQNFLENNHQKAPCQAEGTRVPGVCSVFRCFIGDRVVLSGGSSYEGGSTETPSPVSQWSKQQGNCHTDDAGHGLSFPWVSLAGLICFCALPPGCAPVGLQQVSRCTSGLCLNTLHFRSNCSFLGKLPACFNSLSPQLGCQNIYLVIPGIC